MTTFTTEDKEAVEKSLNAEELADALIKAYGLGGMPALVANALRTIAKRNVELEIEAEGRREAIRLFEKLAKLIHYPDCWDVSVYATIESALIETCAFSNCQECSTPQIKELSDLKAENNSLKKQVIGLLKKASN